MRLLAVVLLLVSAGGLPMAGTARATTSVRVVETWPAGSDVTLGRNQNFYLRLAYDSDTPVQIWARPYFRGKPVNAGSNPSQTYRGSGETYGWFFFMQPGDEVDEVRIRVGDGSAAGTAVVARWRGHVVAGGGADSGGASPAWIAVNNARVEASQRQAYDKRMSTPPSTGEIALFNGFMLVMLALGLVGLGGPAWALWRWRGGWRIAAAVPAAALLFVVLRIMVDGARDPTSHNLWPFEILQVAALSVVVMVVLLVARRLAGVRQ